MTWLDELEAQARAQLPSFVYEYFAMAAGEGVTHREGLREWSAARLRPRVLTEIDEPSTATTVLGHPVATPVLVAPTAQAIAAHPDGEIASGRAVAAAGSVLGVSTLAAVPFSQIGATGAAWWLQVYLTHDAALTAGLVERACSAGARALVLTVDLHSLTVRQPHWEPGSWPDRQLARRGLNYEGLGPGDPDGASIIGLDSIRWLAQISGLPVLVKGVLHPDDAARCVDAGAAGVVVSTHGGRAMDRSITSIGALPAVVDAVAGSAAEVYVDSGLRSGIDVLVALALGARAVFLGRPVLWGLATGGSDGVRAVLDRITAELRSAMQSTGIARPDLASVDVLARPDRRIV